jgi:hypothetical protein
MVWRNLQFNEFSPFKLIFKYLGIHQNSNSQNKSPLGNVWVHSFTFSYSQKCECDCQVAFLARTFPCPCFGREPKATIVTIFLYYMYNYYATPFSYYTFHTFINYVKMFQNKNFNSFHNYISWNLHSYKNLFSSNEGVSKGPKTFTYIFKKMKLNKKFIKVLHITWTMWFNMHINLCKYLSYESPSLDHAH